MAQNIRAIMPSKSKQQKGNKNRKYGRNRKSPANAAYIAENRRFKNKLRRMATTLRKQPNNKPLKSRLDALVKSA